MTLGELSRYYKAMPPKRSSPTPSFEHTYRQADGYKIGTPYGILSVSQDGRQVVFRLWDDVRQSIHNKALFSYYQALIKRGITKVNCDHLELPGLDRSIDLHRGKARLDIVYFDKGRIVEVELKTHREVGIDRTRLQLTEMVPHCQNLIIAVPRQDTENMNEVLVIIGLEKQVTVDAYDLYENESEEGET